MVDRYRHLAWNERGRRKVAEYGLFDIYASRRATEANQEADFLLVEAPDWVTVVPYIEEDQSFLMVRQFRHGSASITLEFPAGVVDRGEVPEIAAGRELLEETGCRPASLEAVGAVSPNPAFMTNTVHTYVATGLSCTEAQSLDTTEILDAERVPVERVIEELGRPPFTNGIMVISLTWFLRWRDRIPPTERP